jgi:hypothetical protein
VYEEKQQLKEVVGLLQVLLSSLTPPHGLRTLDQELLLQPTLI